TQEPEPEAAGAPRSVRQETSNPAHIIPRSASVSTSYGHLSRAGGSGGINPTHPTSPTRTPDHVTREHAFRVGHVRADFLQSRVGRMSMRRTRRNDMERRSAGTNWRRIAASGLVIASASWTALSGAPSVYPTGTTIYHPDEAWNGYTVFITPESEG